MKITESEGQYKNLDQMSTTEILSAMNQLDQEVPMAVEKIISNIDAFVNAAYEKMKAGGRLFYIGAGTSGRLGILDASECPPTFGVSHELVQGLIAGGDSAIRKAVENAEDDPNQAWKDLEDKGFSENDILVGIAASGTTPYVIGAIQKAQKKGILNAGITCNPDAPLAQSTQHPLVAIVGPEFVRGSTRLKAGTAQKLILNMISTSLMVKLGKVVGNKMVDMQLSNAKLVERGTNMIVEETGVSMAEAKKMLLQEGSVRKAIAAIKKA